MLLHTDFIAERRRRRQQKLRLVRWGVWLSLLVAVASLAPAVVVQTVASRRAAELLAARLESRQLSPQASTAVTLRGLLQRVEGPRQVVDAMRQNHDDWAKLLGELRDRLPEEVWLTELAVGPGEPAAASPSSAPQPEVVLVGLATGHEPLSQYLEALNRSPSLRVAELAKSEQADPDAGDGATIRFEVHASLSEPLHSRLRGASP